MSQRSISGWTGTGHKDKRKPKSLLCIGQLRAIEVVLPDGSVKAAACKKHWLAWDGRQYQICYVKGSVKTTLPRNIVARHKKFHGVAPQSNPFYAMMPDRGPTIKNVGLLKSLTYYVPTQIRSPGKNKYLWHHDFGNTVAGQKTPDGGYPTKLMPMLQRDSTGNLFIKRRPGNIFRVSNWLRG